MNFKEIYRSANDDIKGDRSIIENVFNEKKVKKSRSNVIYPFASVAAAAVIMLSVVSFPLFSDRIVENETALSDTAVGTASVPESENPAKVRLKNVKTEVSAEKGEAVQKTEAVSEKKAVVGEDESALVNKSAMTDEAMMTEDAKTEVAPESSEDEVGTATNDSILQRSLTNEGNSEAQSVQNDLPAVASMSLDNGEEAVQSGEKAEVTGKSTYSAEVAPRTSGGGAVGGGSSAKAVNKKIMTADEFFAYIGIRRESFELAGYTLTLPTEVSLTENEGTNYFTAELYLENGNKKINVVIENSHEAAELEIAEYENEIHAYSDNGKVNIYVSGYNASRAEVEGYINLLIK